MRKEKANRGTSPTSKGLIGYIFVSNCSIACYNFTEISTLISITYLTSIRCMSFLLQKRQPFHSEGLISFFWIKNNISSLRDSKSGIQILEAFPRASCYSRFRAWAAYNGKAFARKKNFPLSLSVLPGHYGLHKWMRN